MIHRINFSLILLTCFSLSLLNPGLINAADVAAKDSKGIKQNTAGKISGKVTDIINVSGYTYAEVDTGKEKVWAAGPPTPLKKGDTIAFSTQMPMQNFHSNSLGRDFSVIYFINQYVTNKETSTTASPHDQINQQQTSKPIQNIKKAEGGYTIADIYTDKSKLNGKAIRIRGQVTKFSSKIMGKNWLHIRDSSTLDDLTVTTNGIAAVGDIVITEGKLELDKDYGYGYLYPVILEDAKITKE